MICLLGSATASVGDPSGRTSKRQQQRRSTILSNRDKIHRVVMRIMAEDTAEPILFPNSPNHPENESSPEHQSRLAALEDALEGLGSAPGEGAVQVSDTEGLEEEEGEEWEEESDVEEAVEESRRGSLVAGTGRPGDGTVLGQGWMRVPSHRAPIPEFVKNPESETWPSGRELKKEDLLQKVPEHEPGSFMVLDNLMWWAGSSVLQYLGEVGSHFRINAMLGKSSVQSRLEGGVESEETASSPSSSASGPSQDEIAALALPKDMDGLTMREFSYQTLQSQDFYQLYRDWECSVQVGGADQFGNISAGVDFVRRRRAQEEAAVRDTAAAIEVQKKLIEDLKEQHSRLEAQGALLRPDVSDLDAYIYATRAQCLQDLQDEIQAHEQDLETLAIQLQSLKSTRDSRHAQLPSEVAGFTTPLLTHHNGEKIGKSSSTGQPVFLSPDVTSPFELYQYLVRVRDEEVRQLLMTFTRIQEEAIDKLMAQDASMRLPQFLLANSVVGMLHGPLAVHACEEASRFIYQATVEQTRGNALLTYQHLMTAMVPVTLVSEEDLATHNSLLGLLVKIGVLPSMTQANKASRQGSLYVNQRRVLFDQTLDRESWISGCFLIVRLGKRGIPQVVCRSDLHEIIEQSANGTEEASSAADSPAATAAATTKATGSTTENEAASQV